MLKIVKLYTVTAIQGSMAVWVVPRKQTTFATLRIAIICVPGAHYVNKKIDGLWFGGLPVDLQILPNLLAIHECQHPELTTVKYKITYVECMVRIEVHCH